MAKVGTEKYTWGSPDGIVTVNIDVYYTKSAGFYAKLPDDVVKHTGHTSEIYGDSYEEAASKTKKMCDTFYQKGITQKKVILYHIQKNDSRSSYTPKRPDQFPNYVPAHHSENITSLQIAFVVRWMVTVGERNYISTHEITAPTQLERATKFHWSERGGWSTAEWYQWHSINHTEELEAWFKKTVDNFENLINMISDFFGEKPAALLENINTISFKNLLPSATLTK